MQIHRIQLSPLALWQSAWRRSLRYQPRAMSMEAINIQLAFGFINDFIAAIRRGSNREWGAGGVNKGVRCVAAMCSSANCGKLSLACCCCCCCVCVSPTTSSHLQKVFMTSTAVVDRLLWRLFQQRRSWAPKQKADSATQRADPTRCGGRELRGGSQPAPCGQYVYVVSLMGEREEWSCCW